MTYATFVCLVAQLYLTICEPMDSSPPDSSVHGIFQARILEWEAIPFSRWSFQPSDLTHVSCIAGRFFTRWAIGEAPLPLGRDFPSGSVVKNPPSNTGNVHSTLGWEDPLEKRMATHSSILAWNIPWTEEPSRLHSMGSQWIRYNRAQHTHTPL